MNTRFHLLVLCALLTACSQQGTKVSTLPPEEVLSRTAQATQKLDSAQYVITADFDIDSGNTWQAKGVLRMDGILQNAGKQVRFQTDITAEVEDRVQGNYSLDTTMEIVVMAEDEVYMNVHSLSSQPDSALFKPEIIGKIAGTWWLLPAEEGSKPESVAMTPDPRLLHAQAEVISVTKDNGIEAFASGDAYHYDVELDTEKLVSYLEQLSKEGNQEFNREEVMAALKDATTTGEIWIDTETFFVQKLVWDVQSLHHSATGTADVTFTVTFRNQNNAPTIEPPTEARLFTPAIFFALPSDALFQDEIPSIAPPDFSGQQLDQLLRTLE